VFLLPAFDGAIDRWADELEQTSPTSLFAEDGEYAQYRNIRDDPDFPFARLLELLEPTLQTHFVDSIDELTLDDAFAIHYNEAHFNTTVAKHTDPSDITVNICLRRTDELEGSEVLFYGTKELRGVPASVLSDESFLVEGLQGFATVHWGDHPHETMPLVRGRRTNVVMTLQYKDKSKSTVLQRTCFHSDSKA
jgi:hypothetical protein